MAALKALDRIHQRALVQIGIAGNDGVRRQIAQQAQQPRQSRNAIVGTAGRNGFVRDRELLTVVFPRQLQVVLQRFQGALVAGKGRSDLRQFRIHILAVDQPFTQKAGKSYFLASTLSPNLKCPGLIFPIWLSEM
jgi:hypothetical protein